MFASECFVYRGEARLLNTNYDFAQFMWMGVDIIILSSDLVFLFLGVILVI